MSSELNHKNRFYLEPLYILSILVGISSVLISLFGTTYLLKNIEYFLGGIGLLILLGVTTNIWSLRDRRKRELDRLQSERVMFMKLFHETLERSSKERLITPNFEGLKEKVEEFTQLYPYNRNIALVGMYPLSDRHNEIYNAIKESVRPLGYRVFRPYDEQVAPDILSNVIVLLLGCKYGIAVFDLDPTGSYLQSAAFELGLMYSMGKQVLVLKNSESPSLPIDLLQFVYYEYRDTSEIKVIVEKWFLERKTPHGMTPVEYAEPAIAP